MTTYINKNDKAAILAGIKKNSPALLVGETGIGKTTIINHLAKKEKKILHRISLNGSTTVDEIIGKFVPKGKKIEWIDGLLVQAMKKGDWVVFDEINSATSDILFCLHALLDDDRKLTLLENEGEIIYGHKDFRFFATMNPTDDYIGTKELNPALKSRFFPILEIKHLEPKKEQALLVKKGSDDAHATYLVSFATDLRKLKNELQISYFCSTRDLIQVSELIDAGLDKDLAINYAIINKIDSDDRQYLIDNKVIDNVQLLDMNEADGLKVELKKINKDLTSSLKALDIYKDSVVRMENEKEELNKKITQLENDLVMAQNTKSDGDLQKILDDTLEDRDELIRELDLLKKNEQ